MSTGFLLLRCHFQGGLNSIGCLEPLILLKRSVDSLVNASVGNQLTSKYVKKGFIFFIFVLCGQESIMLSLYILIRKAFHYYSAQILQYLRAFMNLPSHCSACLCPPLLAGFLNCGSRAGGTEAWPRKQSRVMWKGRLKEVPWLHKKNSMAIKLICDDGLSDTCVDF